MADAVDLITAGARSVGYRSDALIPAYRFADVLDPSGNERQVSLAAFTRTPPSFRTAAFGAVEAAGRDAETIAAEQRALGAPLIFVIDGDDASVWQISRSGRPIQFDRRPIYDVPALFQQQRELWSPEALHRARAIGEGLGPYQAQFSDLGLLPLIEGEAQRKLDRLLRTALAAARQSGPVTRQWLRGLFRALFRMLAAKALQDRGHPAALAWSSGDLHSMLQGIDDYYGLGGLPGVNTSAPPRSLAAAWECIHHGMSFANLSSDELAFVYENTLVTEEARRDLGIHSTPRWVAEYIIEHLRLDEFPLDRCNIYEPFAGAGIFLVAACRALSDRLSRDWDDKKRHEWLIRHVAGGEKDEFACEVAKLSLILADYPNKNDWNIEQIDLFDDDSLQGRLLGKNVIVCNPPFEGFTASERIRYHAAATYNTKASAALAAALDVRPDALGFVLPRTFLSGEHFAEHRHAIRSTFRDVHLVALPEHVFEYSGIETALLIARNRKITPEQTRVTTVEVSRRQLDDFVNNPTSLSMRVRDLADSPQRVESDDLWIPRLSQLWRFLADHPHLDGWVESHLGARWSSGQGQAMADPGEDSAMLGLMNVEEMRQFSLPPPARLDMRPSNLTHARKRLWDKPKIVLSGARRARGPWRVTAAVDFMGLAFSQQFIGLWPKAGVSSDYLYGLVAVLNGPLANAFFATHCPAERLRLAVLNNLPIPPLLPSGLIDLTRHYIVVLNQKPSQTRDAELQLLLAEIDGAVLAAYDLPTRLEAELLADFVGAQRPVSHPWTHWDEVYPLPGLRLDERLSSKYRHAKAKIVEAYEPLPAEEADLLRPHWEADL